MYPSTVTTPCTTTNCATFNFYTTGVTINNGDIIYYDPALTLPISTLSVNFGPSGGGYGRMFLSNDCPIVGTRIIAQIDNTGKVISQYPC
jgi:hypothetical protein